MYLFSGLGQLSHLEFFILKLLISKTVLHGLLLLCYSFLFYFYIHYFKVSFNSLTLFFGKKKVS